MSSTGRFSVLDNTEDVGAKVADDHGDGVSRGLSVDGDLSTQPNQSDNPCAVATSSARPGAR